MNRKRMLVLVMVVALCLLVVPAWAGGWAVVTVESLPGEVRAGENVHVEFSVRQHGRELTNQVAPVLRAHNPGTGETFLVEAAALKQKGYFAVDVIFPTEGTWNWSIDPVLLGGKLDLLPLTVLPAAAPSLAGSTLTSSSGPSSLAAMMPTVRTILQVMGVALLIAAMLMAMPRRGREAVSVVTQQ